MFPLLEPFQDQVSYTWKFGTGATYWDSSPTGDTLPWCLGLLRFPSPHSLISAVPALLPQPGHSWHSPRSLGLKLLTVHIGHSAWHAVTAFGQWQQWELWRQQQMRKSTLATPPSGLKAVTAYRTLYWSWLASGQRRATSLVSRAEGR